MTTKNVNFCLERRTFSQLLTIVLYMFVCVCICNREQNECLLLVRMSSILNRLDKFLIGDDY